MSGVSKTALGVGMLRAMHRLVDDPPWVIDDTVSVALFGDAVRASVEANEARGRDDRLHALRGHVLVRSAFADERLARAIRRGVRQVVLLGAGFETLAYRLPGSMNDVRIFEVDLPATQHDKRDRLAGAGIAEPANLTFVPVDFETTSLGDGLRAAGFDHTGTAFFSWLGVTMYLTRGAVEAGFRYVASLPPGSEVAFTFRRPGGDDELAERVAQLGERFQTFLVPDELQTMLLGLGFRTVHLLDRDEGRRLLGERRDSLRLPTVLGIAAAVV